ncbi:MMPL family transporter [Streptomyces tubbatahanensis]|uniref:MMPL family transporter n=1 Tax=Streptomyces tubbatahanensis TaxID=2923272 RepID=A0ABY3XMT5_9ACTN|nr:MMPL family transporter [Streptomyces tubbatahanensis]UNS95724.1 MMPL family transporter [Streptomyces tubbatahanensis]
MARFVAGRSKLILYLSGALLVIAGALGGGVIQKLSTGGFIDSSTESAKTAAVMDERFEAGAPNFTLVITDDRGVDSPEVASAGARLTQRLADEKGVEQVVSYWSSGKAESLRGEDGDRALLLARISGDEDAVQRTFEEIKPRYDGTVAGLDVSLGGTALANQEITETTEQDLLRIEMVTFPILLVVMLFVFRTVVAALAPLMVSALTIVSVLFTLRVLTLFMDVSVLATNVATGLGLGLAIDYSLIFIRRYREQLATGADTDAALATSLRTVGRTVLFSAVTVALALAALLVFPFYFLRSFAYAGIPTALFAAIISVTVLPALLKVLGPRIEKGRVLGRKRKAAAAPPGGESAAFWHRLAVTVMRFPLPVAGAVIALLLLLGAPFLDLRMSLQDERVLPAETQSRQFGDDFREHFESQETQALNVVLSDTPGRGERNGQVTSYAERLSRLDNVARVDTEVGSFTDGGRSDPPTPRSSRFTAEHSTYLSVVPHSQSLSEKGRELVADIRAASAPYPVRVGGPAAELTDSIGAMNDRLPLAIGLIAVSSFIVLFLFTGSLLLPFKALILNTLSLSATLGVLVWGFQDGHLEGVVGEFVTTDSITWTVPVLLFCIAFGLSMDYEVFLLSRIKEEYDKTRDNTLSVARGLARTGSMITSAAVLIAIVFLGFIISGIVYLKAIGIGLALAVLMDATLVRGTLVPAFMQLMGRGNWWAPKPLRALHRKVGLHEGEAHPAPSSADDGPSGLAGSQREDSPVGGR